MTTLYCPHNASYIDLYIGNRPHNVISYEKHVYEGTSFVS